MSPLLFVLLIAAAPLDCVSLAAWHAGREGAPVQAGCEAPEYREAHRLGRAWRELQHERGALEAQAAQATPPALGVLRRRQRQIDVDLEAIRGLATIKGWPHEPAQEPDR